MAKRAYTVIAEHLGQDEETIKDYEYQPGKFTQKVYSFGNYYYAIKEPKDSDGIFTNWYPINSSYDGRTIWMHDAEVKESKVVVVNR